MENSHHNSSFHLHFSCDKMLSHIVSIATITLPNGLLSGPLILRNAVQGANQCCNKFCCWIVTIAIRSSMILKVIIVPTQLHNPTMDVL